MAVVHMLILTEAGPIPDTAKTLASTLPFGPENQVRKAKKVSMD